MREYIEGACSYLASFIGFFVSVNWRCVGSNLLMIGSLILLCMRLYVEYSTLKEKRAGKEKVK